MAGIGGKKLLFATTAAMLGHAMFPAIGAELSFDILAKNITDDAIVVETKPGDVLVFNGGVHTLDGRRLIVIADRIELRGLIREHLERTGSDVASRILDDWDNISTKFVKVFPADYKRVLAELEAEGEMEPGEGPDTEVVDVIGEPATGVATEKGA